MELPRRKPPPPEAEPVQPICSCGVFMRPLGGNQGDCWYCLVCDTTRFKKYVIRE